MPHGEPESSDEPGQAWPPPTPGPDPQAPKGNRTGLIVGICIATAIVVVVIVVGLLATAGPSGKGGSGSRPVAVHTLTMPTAAAGYTHLTGNVGRRLVAAVRRRAQNAAAVYGPSWSAAYTTAKIGFYTKAGATPVVFIGFSVLETPLLASILGSETPSEGLDQFFLGSGVSSTKDFPAGSLGGVLRCGQESRASGPATFCAWGDLSVLGVLVKANTPEAELARVALAFRYAAEH